MEMVYIFLAVSFITNIFLLFGMRNLFKQNEELEDTIITIISGTRNKIQNSLQQMKDIDTRQVFEKDDEVGGTFEQLKNIIEDLNNEL